MKYLTVPGLLAVLTLLQSCQPRETVIETTLQPRQLPVVRAVQIINEGRFLNKMMLDATTDFFRSHNNIHKLAVWSIQSCTSGVDDAAIRRGLLRYLHMRPGIQVVDDGHLIDYLNSLQLSLSGELETSLGHALGRELKVDGFMTGSARLEKEQFVFILKFIPADANKEVWSTTVAHTL